MAYAVTLMEQGLMKEEPAPPYIATNWPQQFFKRPMRWARVRVVLDTTSYSTGGTALNVLTALTGWTRICDHASQRFMQGTTVSYAKLYLENHATTGSRLLQIWSIAEAQHAAAATTACTFDMYLIGV